MGDKLTVGRAVFGPTAVSSGMPPDPLGDNTAMQLHSAWKQLCIDNPARIAALEAEIAKLQASLEKIACRHVTVEPLWWQLEARAALAKSTGGDDG